jgi:hypothetical protein
VGAIGGGVLGAVLLLAAVLKALHPHAFAEEISAQGVTLGLPPFVAALGALALETVLGAALLLNLRRFAVLVAATLLVAFFLLLTGRTAWQAANGELDPNASACGCFGSLVERTPGEAFVQDLLLLVPALGLAWIGRPGARSGLRPRSVTTIAATAAVTAFAIAAPALPIDDWATRLRPGVELDELCAGGGDARICLSNVAPGLASGRQLVIVADVDDDGFAEQGRRMNAWVRSGAEPPIALLADLTPERRQSLYWELAPAFDLHETPAALLRPLYRTLPRSFELDEGRVVETWDGLPPALERIDEPRR